MTKRYGYIRAILVLVLLIIVVVVFTACAAKESDADEGLPKGFTKVSTQDVSGGDLVEYRHVETGCHYVYVSGLQAVSITPMYTNIGSGIPYCTED